MDEGSAIVGAITAAVFYLTPTIIAVIRKQPNKWAIAAMNILLGFTVIGWIIALIWSLTSPTKQQDAPTIIINQVQGDQTSTTTTQPEEKEAEKAGNPISRKFKG